MHKPKIVSVVSNGDTLFPRMEAIRPTISQKALLRRATAAIDAQDAQIAADRRTRAEAIIAAVEREMRQAIIADIERDYRTGTRPLGAPMATRVHAGKSALMTAASVALVAASVALALWLGSL